MVFSKFDKYVDRHSRVFTERLQALCRMPSVAARGTGMRAIAEAVEQSMQTSRNRNTILPDGNRLSNHLR